MITDPRAPRWSRPNRKARPASARVCPFPVRSWGYVARRFWGSRLPFSLSPFPSSWRLWVYVRTPFGPLSWG